MFNVPFTMIPYSRDPHQTVSPSSVKIIGLGGAGANMLERIALDSMEGTELLAINTDARTLGTCIAKEKIQLGVNLTKGLGAGGDPELGQQAAFEAEEQIRAAVKDRRIVFLCTGLGGGTGSGAAPIVTRIAREEGAFVVIFATMPFAFEGKRRRDQADTSLNELAVLANALVTFDNNRMGELVLAKQGIHEAFVAADHMISESIKAVIRLVVRPGLINVGLDDLMSALRTNRSRCLFGSGLADGKDRASKALRNALSSPLLDQGTLLKEAQTVLVHLCGGEDLTLFEIELLMQGLQKHVPESAHVLFGAAVDPAMGDLLSLTLISALPEDSLAMTPREALSQTSGDAPTQVEDMPAADSKSSPSVPAAAAAAPTPAADDRPFAEPEAPEAETLPTLPEPEFKTLGSVEPKPAETATNAGESGDELPPMPEPPPTASITEFISKEPHSDAGSDTDATPDPESVEAAGELSPSDLEPSGLTPIPQRRPPGNTPWTPAKGLKKPGADLEAEPSEPLDSDLTDDELLDSELPDSDLLDSEAPKLKLEVKAVGPQSELSLDSSPRGRFEGENPNVFEGEDLDLPPFLRKKK